MLIPPRSAYISDGFLVKRVLPYAKKRTVGPFVFLDHFAVDAAKLENDVGPHPHIGLATLTYLYDGATLHRDSTGAEKLIRPGEVNYMISGRGVVHSERNREILKEIPLNAKGQRWQEGLQIWMALAKEEEQREAAFIGIAADQVPDITASFSPQSPSVQGKNETQAKLLIGDFAHAHHTLPLHPSLRPCFLVDVQLGPDASVTLPSLPANIEVGLYASRGDFVLAAKAADEQKVVEGDCLVFEVTDSTTGEGLVIKNPHADRTIRLALLGGKALPEARHMFWNFVATDKAIIARAAEAWKALDRGVFPPVVNEDNKDSIPLPATTPSAHAH